MGKAVILNPSGGTTGALTGGSTPALSSGGIQKKIIIPVIFNAQQIAGLVKMIPCNFVDCRATTSQAWCYSLPVFGNGEGASYSNDLNSFLISFTGQGTPEFVIQKANDSFFGKLNQVESWTNFATITDNTYGIYQPLGSIANHPTYMSFTVDWGKVFHHSGGGAGYYRIIFQSCVTVMNSGGAGSAQATSIPIDTPYDETGGFYSYPTTNSVKCDFTFVCGNQTWIVPSFFISAASSLSELNSILAALNGFFTANNVPLVAKVYPPNPTAQFYIQGTQYQNQNGCSVAFKVTLYGGGSILNIYENLLPGMTGGNNGSPTINCTCGLQSPSFRLLGWDCNRAHGTVKLECWNQGTLGDVNNPGSLFDLCGLSLYDSVRFEGFFGFNKYSYDEILLEYGISANTLFGTIERVRDKMIPAYKLNTKPLPAWLHKQLANVMMMADTVLVSDYNINNADYFIQRKNVIKKGNYEPKYHEKGKHFDLSLQEFGRRDPVSIEFLEGIQSVIKSTCCLSATSAA